MRPRRSSAIVAASAALDAVGGVYQAFLTVVAATMVVTLLTAATFLLLGTFRLGNLARFIPYPVVGGFLAGTGWLLFKGGLRVASGMTPQIGTIKEFVDPFELVRWGPAVAFGVILLIATRVVRRSLVIPVVLGIGLLLFAIGMLVTGSSIQDARTGLWLLGPFTSTQLWQPWTLHALGGADWTAVLDQAAGIATTVLVAVMACLFNVGGVELLLHTDLDSNQELRDAGLVNVVTGLLGAIPGYHALSLTALAEQMSVDGRGAGLVAALVPLAAVIFGAGVVGLVPRMIVGGVLVFVGLSFLVSWIFDMRRSLPVGEYLIVLAIVLTIATGSLLAGLVVGLILSVVLFAVNYGRIDLVHEIAFGTTYRSNVDRPPGERAALHDLVDRVQILRLSGFVFFGTASGLLERIRKRVEAGPIRFLLLDVQRVTGVDSSGVLALHKAVQLAGASGFEVVFAGAAERVEDQLRRGGVVATEGIVRFEPDLDRGLQRCEDVLLAEARAGGRARYGRWSRRPAAPSRGLSRAPVAPRGHRADPTGRSARRPVRAGVGPIAGRADDARGGAAPLEHGEAGGRGGRGGAVLRGSPDGGRDRRGAERGPRADPRVDRASGGRGTRDRRGAPSMARDDALGATDRRATRVLRPARLSRRLRPRPVRVGFVDGRRRCASDDESWEARPAWWRAGPRETTRSWEARPAWWTAGPRDR